MTPTLTTTAGLITMLAAAGLYVANTRTLDPPPVARHFTVITHRASHTPVVRSSAVHRPGYGKDDYRSGVTGTTWKHFPIRVRFDGSWSAYPAYKAAAIAGLDEWVKATGGRVSYILVTAKPEDVLFRYAGNGDGCYSDLDADDKTHLNSHVVTTICSNDMFSFREERLDFLRTVTAHEFGHDLGIGGHSPVVEDLMFEATDYPKPISARDLNTLNKVYGWQ